MEDCYWSLLVGSLILLATIPCIVYYVKIMRIILRDRRIRRRPSYQLMIAIGVADVAPCFAHLVTGLYTIFNVEVPMEVGKILGVIATPSYVTYTILTLILALNRLIQAWNPELNNRLFRKERVIIWIAGSLLFWAVFAAVLAHPDATIRYHLSRFSWGYDEDLPLSSLIKRAEMCVELGSIFLSAVCYFVVLLIFARKKSVISIAAGQHLELRILVQAVLITGYCTVLNVLWHNSYLLPDSVYTSAILNFMWIFNSWVYPLVYIIVNRTIRDRSLERVRSLANTTTNGTSSVDGLSLSHIRVKRNPIEKTLGAFPRTSSADQRHKPFFIT